MRAPARHRPGRRARGAGVRRPARHRRHRRPGLPEILRAHPGVRGQVLDVAATARAARERFAAAELTERAGAVAGSFFDPLPAGFDAYLLCDVLHDWDDERAAAILSGCARAASPTEASTGTVLVVDALRDDAGGTAAELFMLMCFGGRKRTLDELRALAAGCGVTLRTAGPVTSERTLLEFGTGRAAL